MTSTLARTCLLTIFIALCNPVVAQDFRAALSGQVTDTSGSPVSGAKVTATNLETNIANATQSNASGNFSIPALPPGRYQLTAEMVGFRRWLRTDLTLEVQARVQVDIQLEIGDAKTTLEVSGDYPLLETASANRGGVITGQTLVDLPLNGRNAFALASLEPGVVLTARTQTFTFLRTTGNNGFSSFSFSGGQLRSNESLLDGVPNTGSDGLVQYVPSVDATSEFKVQTNSFDAEYGRFTGGVINAAIRSGTNDLHGTLFHFVRNSVWNARDPFARSIPQFGYNLFGGSAGGPVYIPKLYKGRNRTFWFFNYEGSREGVPRANVATVPSLLERQGDFSQSRVRSGANVLPITVHDPLTTRQSGAAFTRDPFPNAQIPRSRIDPVGGRVMELFQQPNAVGDPVTGANNYQLAFKDPLFDNGYVMKFDHRFSDRHSMFFRHSWREFRIDRGNVFNNPVTSDFDRRDAPGYALDNTITLNPTTVINIRYGMSRYDTVVQANNLGTSPTTLGLPDSFAAQVPLLAIPQMTFSNGITSISAATKFSRMAEDSHTARGSVTKIISRHSLKAGAELRVINSNVGNLGAAAAGTFAFDQGFTRGPNPQVAGVNIGHGLASLLLGFPSGGSVVNNAATADRTTYHALFFHDDWRLGSKLTLNLGLRYEWEGPYTERYNRLNRGFDFQTASPIAAAARAAYAANPIAEIAPANFNVNGGLLFAGVGGQPRSLTDFDGNNIAPRIGAAWQLTSKTVLRGGYGIFYGASTQTGENRNGFSVTTPFVSSIDGGLTPASTLRNPFPTGLLEPAGASEGLRTLVGQGVGFTSPMRRQPYSQQYTFGFQHQLPWNTLLEATYIGSAMRDLPTSRQLNPIPEQFRAAAEQTFFQTGRNPLADAVTNPFFGIIASGPLSGRTLTRGQLLRPHPQFTSVLGESLPVGTTRYDSLQIKAVRRFAEGFSLTASYAFSKQLDRTRYLNEQDDQLVKELNDFDLPQRFVASGAYELPIGPGKRFLSFNSGFLARLLEGFQLNVIYQAQSGFPLSIAGAESTGVSARLDAADQTTGRWFNTAAFRQRQPVELVRTSRLPDVRSAGKNNFDISIFKTTRITEQVRLQFRAESFNAFNRPEWSSPNTTFGTAQFGQVTSANTFARQLQFALKLLF